MKRKSDHVDGLAEVKGLMRKQQQIQWGNNPILATGIAESHALQKYLYLLSKAAGLTHEQHYWLHLLITESVKTEASSSFFSFQMCLDKYCQELYERVLGGSIDLSAEIERYKSTYMESE